MNKVNFELYEFYVSGYNPQKGVATLSKYFSPVSKDSFCCAPFHLWEKFEDIPATFLKKFNKNSIETLKMTNIDDIQTIYNPVSFSIEERKVNG